MNPSQVKDGGGDADLYADQNIWLDDTDVVNEPIQGKGVQIHAETKTFLFALGLCQTAQLFANRHNQLFILHILLPSSNQDIQMIIQEVSSAQKLFPIVRQNQISSVVKFINQWRHVSAIRVQMCNHFLQHNFSPRKTSQPIQQRWLLFSVGSIGKLARANDGISWKNLGTTTTAKILENLGTRTTAANHPLPICQWLKQVARVF